jgi:hypothetical protein
MINFLQNFIQKNSNAGLRKVLSSFNKNAKINKIIMGVLNKLMDTSAGKAIRAIELI